MYSYFLQINIKSFLKHKMLNDYMIKLKRVLYTWFNKGVLHNICFFFLKKNIYRNTIIKSPHVNKQSQDQFEIQTYNIVFMIKVIFLHRLFFNNILKVIENLKSVGIDLKYSFHEKK